MRDLWALQERQQAFLGLDPAEMNEVGRVEAHKDLCLLLQEEAAELTRVIPAYKRHLLRRAPVDKHAVAVEVVDVVKTALSIAQLHGLTAEEFERVFVEKTSAVESRATQERQRLVSDTRLVCFDLDDVICDLEPWRTSLQGQRLEDVTDVAKLAHVEDLKNGFYLEGGFRAMDVRPGAQEALASLRAEGYVIAIITARPQWQYKRLYADTVDWLLTHQIPYDILLFNKDKVEAVYEHLTPAWPVVFVEDHVKNARALADVGIQVLLVDHPHNADFEGKNVKRVFSWEQILKEIRDQ